MTASPSVHAKLAEVAISLGNMKSEVIAVGIALDASDRVLADARLKNLAVMTRIQDLMAEIEVIKAMRSIQ
jgi:hypothetical protein